jgi:hypothetical protein
VVPLKGKEQNILQSSDPNAFPLYLLPQTSGTGKDLTSNKNYGSVTGTIGSARIITMGIHINY